MCVCIYSIFVRIPVYFQEAYLLSNIANCRLVVCFLSTAAYCFVETVSVREKDGNLPLEWMGKCHFNGIGRGGYWCGFVIIGESFRKWSVNCRYSEGSMVLMWANIHENWNLISLVFNITIIFFLFFHFPSIPYFPSFHCCLNVLSALSLFSSFFTSSTACELICGCKISCHC